MSRKPHHLTWLAHVLRSFVHQKFVSIKRCFHALLHGPPREFLQGASNTTVLLIYVPIKQIYIYVAIIDQGRGNNKSYVYWANSIL